jgi:hypothetical protein
MVLENMLLWRSWSVPVPDAVKERVFRVPLPSVIVPVVLLTITELAVTVPLPSVMLYGFVVPFVSVAERLALLSQEAVNPFESAQFLAVQGCDPPSHVSIADGSATEYPKRLKSETRLVP